LRRDAIFTGSRGNQEPELFKLAGEGVLVAIVPTGDTLSSVASTQEVDLGFGPKRAALASDLDKKSSL